MKAEAGYGINRYKSNRACSCAVQKCSTEIQTEQQLIGTPRSMFFPPYFDALLLWGEMVRCKMFPWHHALKQGSISVAWELLWLINLSHSCCVHTWGSFLSRDYGVSKCMHCSWKSPPKRMPRYDWSTAWNELAVLLNGTEVLCPELQCWFGILAWYCWRGTEFSPSDQGGWAMCPLGVCPVPEVGCLPVRTLQSCTALPQSSKAFP